MQQAVLGHKRKRKTDREAAIDFSSCVILGQLLNSSLPQFPHLSSGENNNSNHLMKLGDLSKTHV